MPASFSSSSSLAPTLHSLSSLRRRSVVSIFVSSKNPLHGGHRFASSGLRLFASIAERRSLELSWSSPEVNSGDGYGGWAVSDPPVHNHSEKRGLPVFVVGGVGASLAVIVAAIAYLSLSRKGFKFRISSPVDGVVNTVDSEGSTSTTMDRGECDGGPIFSEPSLESEPNAVSENVTSTFTEKIERVVIPVAVDATQWEALTVLKKLKILEDEVKANELCTRREYGRWLIRMNSLLERDPRYRVIPSVSLSGSTTSAFDDVSVDDIDFGWIQALAEAGVVSSKLSKSGYNGLNGNGDVCFSPNRFVSRQDLIEWKAQLEYQIAPGMTEEIITTEVGFMDMKEMKSEASPGLYKDILAGNKSILRKVFGQSKRFQPNKPSTKAQAAVALTSGRMAEAIRNELLRLEAENSARLAEMQAILSELLERGDIKRLWDEKLNEEKARGFEMEKAYLTAVGDLENEKVIQEKHFADNLKEKAAMDCQRQLLLTLKEEVDEMSEKLASERTSYVAEQCNLRDMLSDLESKQEEILDAKSILKAEIEALRILRSWVEDEARKSQARAKVLEEVGRRWKWDDQS